MNCPQCGSDNYTAGAECRVCGFLAGQNDDLQPVQIPMNVGSRDVMNGFGVGCSTLAFVWFFVESIVFALAAHNPSRWSVDGPLLSVTVPIVVGILFYALLQRKPSAFSKGVGYCLLVTLVFAIVFAYVGTRYHDNKPAANGSNGFE